MTIDNYLHTTRGNFVYAEEPMKEIFDNLARSLELDITCVVINSSKARTECINLGGQHYIIWDLRYWKLYEHYLYERLQLDEAGLEREKANQILWNMGLNFFSFFRSYYPENSRAGCKFNAMCIAFGLIDEEDGDYSPPFIEECLFVSKLFTFTHEIYHVFFDENVESRKRVEENVRSALRRFEPKIKEDSVKWKEHFDIIYSEEEIEELVNQLIQNDDIPVYDELMSDAAAFYQTCFSYCSNICGNNRSDWPIFIPKIRNFIFDIQEYELLFKALILSTDNIMNHGLGLVSEPIKQISQNHSQSILLREFMMQYIELDQLSSLFGELPFGQIVSLYNIDVTRPYRHSYYQYILPYFKTFASKIILPTLLGPS